MKGKQNKGKEITFKGRVVRCTYNSPDYKVYALEVDISIYPDVKRSKYGTVSVFGDFQELGEEQVYEIQGIEQENKYGYGYKVTNIRKDKPMSEHDMYVFLQEILTFSQASELYREYPDIIDRVIQDRIDDIDFSKLKGIKEATFARIRQKIIDNYALCELVAKYNGVFTLAMLRKIHEEYPSVKQIEYKLQKEPYPTLTRISGIGFIKADAMLLELEKAKKIDFGFDLRTSQQRCTACVEYLLEKNEEEGNTKMDLRVLRQQVKKMVPSCSQHYVQSIQSSSIWYNKETYDIALTSTYAREQYIARRMAEGLKIVNKWDYDWKSYQTKGEYNLSDEQIELLHAVCEENIVILSGGAGMGKSASTGMLIQMLKDNNKTFALGTPTGKSAKVLAVFTGENAMTVHRLLRYSPAYGWMVNEDCPLDVDVLLLDETSMFSIDIFFHILKAIDFNRTKLVLVGDPNQLPSIAAGNLLHDFLHSGVIPIVKLTKVFRYGEGGVLTVATDINNGKQFVDNKVGKVTKFGKNGDYSFVKSEDETIVKDTLALYQNIITKGINGKKYEPKDIAVLTAYNKGEYGAAELNKKIQAIANKNYGSDTKFVHGTNVYYIDDILMQQANNYKAKVYFGEYGTEEKEVFIANGECLHVKDILKDSLVSEMDGLDIESTRADLNNMSLAYSYTIHKSQGSSVKVVLLVTPRSHVYMMNANLLYVGVTRTVDYCFHLGLPSTINMAIKKKENYNRETFMQGFLKEFTTV